MKRNNQSLTTKFSALALVLAMMLSLLAGCGQTTQPAASSTPPAASSEPAASEPETPEIPETMEGDEFGNGAIGTHGGVSSGSVDGSPVRPDQPPWPRRWPPLSQWACVSPT